MTSKMSKDHFSIFHTNIRSYNKNLTLLTTLLHELNFEFDVIGLTETWHTKHDNFFSETIPLYSNYESTCGDTQNSGCGLYIKKGINFTKRNDLSFHYHERNCEFETLFIEIHKESSKNILVGVIYRHPDTNSEIFCEKVESLLNICENENKETIIMGDFNINVF